MVQKLFELAGDRKVSGPLVGGSGHPPPENFDN